MGVKKLNSCTDTSAHSTFSIANVPESKKYKYDKCNWSLDGQNSAIMHYATISCSLFAKKVSSALVYFVYSFRELMVGFYF